jgi:hypothetical protein
MRFGSQMVRRYGRCGGTRSSSYELRSDTRPLTSIGRLFGRVFLRRLVNPVALAARLSDRA